MSQAPRHEGQNDCVRHGPRPKIRLLICCRWGEPERILYKIFFRHRSAPYFGMAREWLRRVRTRTIMNLFLLCGFRVWSFGEVEAMGRRTESEALVVLEVGGGDGFLGKPTPSNSNSMTSLSSACKETGPTPVISSSTSGCGEAAVVDCGSGAGWSGLIEWEIRALRGELRPDNVTAQKHTISMECQKRGWEVRLPLFGEAKIAQDERREQTQHNTTINCGRCSRRRRSSGTKMFFCVLFACAFGYQFHWLSIRFPDTGTSSNW